MKTRTLASAPQLAQPRELGCRPLGAEAADAQLIGRGLECDGADSARSRADRLVGPRAVASWISCAAAVHGGCPAVVRRRSLGLDRLATGVVAAGLHAAPAGGHAAPAPLAVAAGVQEQPSA